MLISTPCSIRCVAKAWRRLCTVACLPMPAASTAAAQAAFRVDGSSGFSPVRPGNSQGRRGRSISQLGPQDPEQLRRQHHIALLAALAISHVDHHATAVDVFNAQPYDLTGTQACSVRGCERDTISPARNRLEKGGDLLWAQDHGKRFGSARIGNALGKVFASQCDAIEKAQR